MAVEQPRVPILPHRLQGQQDELGVKEVALEGALGVAVRVGEAPIPKGQLGRLPGRAGGVRDAQALESLLVVLVHEKQRQQEEG